MNRSVFRQGLSLIDKQYYWRGVGIVALLIVSSILEFFTIASFLPLLFWFVDPGKFASSGFTHWLQSRTNETDPRQLIIAITIAAVVFVMIKSVIISGIVSKKARYAYAIANNIASRALDHYLNKTFLSFAKVDYAKAMHHITSHPLTFANNFLIPLGTILAEGLLTVALLTAIAIWDIRAFIFILGIAAPVILLFWLRRERVRALQSDIKTNYPRVLKYALQAVEGLPEIKALGKEHFFKDQFSKTYKKLGKSLSSDHIFTTAASRYSEIMAALAFGGLVIYSFVFEKSGSQALVLISLYAGVAFRITPSVQRIATAFTQIQIHRLTIEELYQETSSQALIQKVHQPKPFVFQQLELRDISFSYDGGTEVLKNISFVIQKGDSIMITGRSGSGKTTLFLLLLQFLKQSSGQLLWNGRSMEDIRGLIGYVPQNPYMLDASIAENIAFGISPTQIDLNKIDGIIENLGLKTWIEKLPSGLNTMVGEKGTRISGGQRQRIAIARALYADAQLFLLDEITNQLDQESEHEIVSAIRQLAAQHKTVIFITHKKSLIENFSSVYELKDGKLVLTNIPTAAM